MRSRQQLLELAMDACADAGQLRVFNMEDKAREQDAIALNYLRQAISANN